MTTIQEIRQKYPQYNDLSDQQLADGFHDKFYSDIPKEQFYSKIGIKNIQNNSENNFIKDNFSAQGIKQQANDLASGFTQGIANIAPGLGNLGVSAYNATTGNNAEKFKYFDYAPKNIASEAGNIGSYFVPGAAFKAISKIPHIASVGKAALTIPLIANALKKATGIIGKSPIASKILSSAAVKEIPGNALLGAIYDQSNQGQGAALGTGLGTANTALTSLMKTPNPLVKGAARAALGAGIGYGLNGTTGAEYGAAAGLSAPFVANKLGIGGKQAGLETLEHINPESVRPAVEAGNRLGTPITPAEASENPNIGRLEAKYGKNGEAAALKTDIGLDRIKRQKSAINNLLNTVYDKSIISDNNIRNLYKKSYESNVSDEILSTLKSDLLINFAFDKVKKSPVLSKDLEGISENNYAYLDQVKRALDDMKSKAKRAGENNEARIIGKTNNDLVSLLDKGSPDYAIARQEAQKRITRNKIKKYMKNENIKGSVFYKKVLENDENFEGLLSSLKNVPEAQNQLKDMRLAWKNLINIETPRGAAGKEENSMTRARATVQALEDIFYNMTGQKTNIKGLNFIHNPKWIDEFNSIYKMKNKENRTAKYANLIGKIGTAGIITNQ